MLLIQSIKSIVKGKVDFSKCFTYQIVTMGLSTKFQANDIKEGGDVYFECNAYSNPPITKLEWMHNVISKLCLLFQMTCNKN